MTHQKCSRCGTDLPVNAPEGLCPRCLGALNFVTETTLTGADAIAVEPPLTPGELSPHFPQLEIIECLGRGGMGVVYKARQKSLNRLVALKLLAPERVLDPKFAERFAREAQALAQLNHPNVVTIHDFGQASGFYYLLMEYVDGLNLRQILRARKLEPSEALAVVPAVCEALQYAHDHGIVHCDIKPENLLLDKTGRVKIADFGIARMLSAEAAGGQVETQTAGTPQYMAPEQRTDPRNADHRADIYSLGVVLYELLTGELPNQNLQPPSSRAPIDTRLDHVVLRALDQRPEARYQTAADFGTQVQTIATSSDQPHSRAPLSTLQNPKDNTMTEPKSPPHVLRWVLVALTLLFVVVASPFVLWFALRSPLARPSAPALSPPPAVQTPADRANWSSATFNVHAADGLYQTSTTSCSIKGGRAFMQVRRKKDDSLEFRFVYPFDELLPAETIMLLRTRWSLGQVEKLADSLNITPEQLQQLKTVSPATDIPVDKPDREKVRALFNDYLSADDKAAAEKALVEAVTAIDQKYYARTIEMIGKITGQVKQIFQEDQLGALSNRFTPQRLLPEP